MDTSLNCFVSYCHEKVDRESLDFFVEHLKDRQIFPNMQIHIDGVGKEYKWIVHRYYEMKAEAQKEAAESEGILNEYDIPNFDLISIIISGLPSDSTPDIVAEESLNYYNFSTFNVIQCN